MPYTEGGTGWQATDTSLEAALEIEQSGRKQTLQDKVWAAIVKRGPISPTSLTDALGWEYSLRPRFSELKKAGRIRWDGGYFLTKRGRRERTYIPVTPGKEVPLDPDDKEKNNWTDLI